MPIGFCGEGVERVSIGWARGEWVGEGREKREKREGEGREGERRGEKGRREGRREGWAHSHPGSERFSTLLETFKF